MRAIVCEMCGGRELLKKDDVYICQSCGTRYAPEEAKKLLVTVDHSESVKNSIQNGRRAWECRDWPEAERYYNLAEQYDHQNAEAVFFSAFARLRRVYDSSGADAWTQAFETLIRTAAVLSQNRDEAVAERVASHLSLFISADLKKDYKGNKTVSELTAETLKTAKLMDQLADAVAKALLAAGMDRVRTLRLCLKIGEALADSQWATFEVQKKWLAACETYASELTDKNRIVTRNYGEAYKRVEAKERGYSALGCLLPLLIAVVVLILLHSIFGS